MTKLHTERLGYGSPNAEEAEGIKEDMLKRETSFRESGIYVTRKQDPYKAQNVNKKDGSIDYGKYQVNEATLAHWDERFLGKEVTTKEFLNSPELQEKFFEEGAKHLQKLGAKTLSSFLMLWHFGWSDISTSRINKLRKSEEGQKYLNNRPSKIYTY